MSQRTFAKDAVLYQDCLPFTAALYHNDHPAYLKFHDVSKCQYHLSRLDPFSHDLHENGRNFAAIRHAMNKDYAESRLDSVAITTIVHGDLTSDSNIVQSDDPSYSSALPSVSKLLPSPAPNIVQSNDPSSSSALSSADSKLSPSPAPNIVQSDDPSSSYDQPSESKLLPSPASDMSFRIIQVRRGEATRTWFNPNIFVCIIIMPLEGSGSCLCDDLAVNR